MKMLYLCFSKGSTGEYLHCSCGRRNMVSALCYLFDLPVTSGLLLPWTSDPLDC
jgi:hypothetical protein